MISFLVLLIDTIAFLNLMFYCPYIALSQSSLKKLLKENYILAADSGVYMQGVF